LPGCSASVRLLTVELPTRSYSSARNFFVVVFATIFVYYGFWVKGEYKTFSLAGRIPSELPPFQDPYISSDRFSVCFLSPLQPDSDHFAATDVVRHHHCRNRVSGVRGHLQGLRSQGKLCGMGAKCLLALS
jgi:hypothetical protein